MSKRKYILTIKDILEGVDIRTEVDSYSFSPIQSGSMMLGGAGAQSDEINLVREADKNSHHFVRLSVQTEQYFTIRRSQVLIPEAVLSINLYSWKGGLQKRTVIILTEITGVTYLSGNSGNPQVLEQIGLHCNKIAMRDSSLEDAPPAEQSRWTV